jgi:hypothetical protein
MLRTQERPIARASAMPNWPSIAVTPQKMRSPAPTQTRAEKTSLRLGTLLVSGEVAMVAGTITKDAAATAELEVNGHHTPIDADGSFCANVRFAGKPFLTLSLETRSGESLTMEIPLRANAARPQFHSTRGQAA